MDEVVFDDSSAVLVQVDAVQLPAVYAVAQQPHFGPARHLHV